MAAWKHTTYWSASAYADYRSYVAENAAKHRGETPDCADISIGLLIEFASQRGLTVSFWDADGAFFYSSKAAHSLPALSGRWWGSTEAFLNVVRDRIDANGLYRRNTIPVQTTPQPGDLLLKPAPHAHAALVIEYYPPGKPHLKEHDATILDFPGPTVAAKQLHVREYFGEPRTRTAGRLTVSPPALKEPHVDYLNHRGEGTPVKQEAEVIYYRKVADLETQGLEFRMYNRSVLNDLPGWDGSSLTLPAH